MRGALLLTSLVALLLAGCGGSDEAATTTTTTTAPAEISGPLAAADLTGVKSYLTEHTDQLVDFTGRFRSLAQDYDKLAAGVDYDHARLLSQHRSEVAPLLAKAKDLWTEGNPYYERMEGIVAGTPSLAEYDIIIDAGSSKAEDPASAVPFDLELADGRVLEQPGNLYNLTEGMLWGTRPEFTARVSADLDADGKVGFGEALPDAHVFTASANAFDRYARELATKAQAWQPTPSDAFTALVVMVPTMSEYFGQWKESRFVRGDAATGDSFNVVSRLSDIDDIISGLEVVFDGVEPAIAEVDAAGAAQTRSELSGLASFIADLRTQESSGHRFAPEQADQLGVEAQERGSAVAGQVTQHAAQLAVAIQQ
jgi:hypothetical protein